MNNIVKQLFLLAAIMVIAVSCVSKEEKREREEAKNVILREKIVFDAYQKIYDYAVDNQVSSTNGSKLGAKEIDYSKEGAAMDVIVPAEAAFSFGPSFITVSYNTFLNPYYYKTERGELTRMIIEDDCGFEDCSEYYGVSIQGRWNNNAHLVMSVSSTNTLDVYLFGDAGWKRWVNIKLPSIQYILDVFNSAKTKIAEIEGVDPVLVPLDFSLKKIEAIPNEIINEPENLEVVWPNDFHWDSGYYSYIYGLESGCWRYESDGVVILFDFNNGFNEENAIKITINDLREKTQGELKGTWEPVEEKNGDVDKEVVNITLENGERMSLEYDRKNYSMKYKGLPLIYLVKPINGEAYQNQDISLENAKLFLNQFYEKFLNLRKDGSFTMDILIDNDGVINGLKTEFLNLLTEAMREHYKSYPTSQDRDPDYEISFAGLWKFNDILFSRIPKDIVYLGNLGKYNFKVEMDYQDGTHSVLYRLVEDNGTLLIDEATAAY